MRACSDARDGSIYRAVSMRLENIYSPVCVMQRSSGGESGVVCPIRDSTILVPVQHRPGVQSIRHKSSFKVDILRHVGSDLAAVVRTNTTGAYQSRHPRTSTRNLYNFSRKKKKMTSLNKQTNMSACPVDVDATRYHPTTNPLTILHAPGRTF